MKKKIILTLLVLAAAWATFYYFYPLKKEKLTVAESGNLLKNSPFGMLPFFSFKEPIGASVPDPDQFDFEPTKDLGLKWGRAHYLIWPNVQPSKSEVDQGIFNWSESDNILATYPEGFMNVQNLVAFPARKTDTGEFVETFSFPSYEAGQDYKKFVQKAAERYDGDGQEDAPGLKSPVKYWQVDNEQDLKSNDWRGYADVLKLSYEGIKSTCPDCKVVAGGLGGELKGLATFLKPALDSLQGQYFDVLDYHCYGAKNEWKKCGDLAEDIRKAFPGKNLEIWLSETGTWSGAPSYPPNLPEDSEQSEADQAAALVKFNVYPLAKGVKKIFWAWGIIEGFGGPENNIFDNTGLIYDGLGTKDLGRGVKKLSYYTYRKLIEELEGADLNNIGTVSEGSVYAYKFNRIYGKDKGRPVWIAWSESADIKDVLIGELAGREVLTTESIPKYKKGKEAEEADLFREGRVKVASGDKVPLPSGGIPVYIEIIR